MHWSHEIGLLNFHDHGSDFVDCTSWTWLPIFFNIPGWPFKAGLLLCFPHLQGKSVQGIFKSLKIAFNNLRCFLLNSWNWFHHDLLLPPWAVNAGCRAVFPLLSCAPLLPPYQGCSTRHSKAGEVDTGVSGSKAKLRTRV